ncbi:MAG: hypothetical protein GC160_04395 [Acidobacteria bacterium]|nr:hypothetical protein [Acidobacteriota bacterium]
MPDDFTGESVWKKIGRTLLWSPAAAGVLYLGVVYGPRPAAPVAAATQEPALRPSATAGGPGGGPRSMMLGGFGWRAVDAESGCAEASPAALVAAAERELGEAGYVPAGTSSAERFYWRTETDQGLTLGSIENAGARMTLLTASASVGCEAAWRRETFLWSADALGQGAFGPQSPGGSTFGLPLPPQSSKLFETQGPQGGWVSFHRCPLPVEVVRRWYAGENLGEWRPSPVPMDPGQGFGPNLELLQFVSAGRYCLIHIGVDGETGGTLLAVSAGEI